MQGYLLYPLFGMFSLFFGISHKLDSPGRSLYGPGGWGCHLPIHHGRRLDTIIGQ
jgi:hypothetical protein